MDANQLAEILVDWVKETCPDLLGAYAHDPATKTQPLPDVAVFVDNERDAPGDPTLGLPLADFGIEQATAHISSVTVMLMVAPTDDDSADQELRTFIDQLANSVRAQNGLGGRIAGAAPYWSASYEPPFVEFDDSTKGRAATFSLTVAELI
jgi:hypothetical protein